MIIIKLIVLDFTGERCEISTQLAVTVHPQSIVIPLGRNVTLTCKADISGKLVYAWERKHSQKWTIISNYNSATYTTSIFGQYRCKVSDKKITAVSGVAIVKVQQGPLKLILTTQPKNSFKKTGDFHTLTCNASGPGTLTYSWERKADLKWTIVSRHEPSYNTSMEGHYRCRVANEAGSVVSKKAFIKYYSEYAYQYIHRTHTIMQGGYLMLWQICENELVKCYCFVTGCHYSCTLYVLQ